MGDSLGNKAAVGALWATIDKFSMMGLQFVVNLILARLLDPSDFGIIGMLTIFIAVSTVLIDGGFGSALIQKKKPTQADYSTIFYWNILISIILYGILYIVAPYVGEYFKMPVLSGVLRGIGLTLIFTGIIAVQRARLQKALAFRALALTNIGAYVTGSLLAITMAYNGWGVWSLVLNQIVYGIMAVGILAVITGWHPTFRISRRSMKELFGFGGYILAANILQEVCKNLQGIIIGKRFSATQMGFYSQAHKLDTIASNSIPQVIVQVMYPVYSSLQDDRERLKALVEMNMRVIAFIVYPILCLLILFANPLIQLLYGEKWLPSVPYFQILCVGGFFICLQNLNFYAVAAVGKSKSSFRWSFYKWGFLGLALLLGMNFGMYGILWGMVLSNINIFMTNAYLASKFTGLKIMKQVSTISPVIMVNACCFMVSVFLGYIDTKLFLVIIIFVMLYFSLALIFHLKAYEDFNIVVNKLLKREK